MKVVLLLFFASLWMKQIGAAADLANITNVKNNVTLQNDTIKSTVATNNTLFNITPLQAKLTIAQDLTKEQLQEVEKEKLRNGNVTNSAAEAQPRLRKITKTDTTTTQLTNGTQSNPTSATNITSVKGKVVSEGGEILIVTKGPTVGSNNTLVQNTTAPTITRTTTTTSIVPPPLNVTQSPSTDLMKNSNITSTIATTNTIKPTNNQTGNGTMPTINSTATTSTTVASNKSTLTTAATTSAKSSTTTTITTTSAKPSITTTTTTTTTNSSKPKILYSRESYPNLDDEVLKQQKQSSSSSSFAPNYDSKFPQPEPHVQPSQELSSSMDYRNDNNDYIVPIITIIFTVPLAIGVLITTYRRFRDFWSTRHYRRMDFLVDGMYND